ncbi:hypothetical protein EJ110_NYTH09812 [Nymphaea thermarum]|nr:hypothetical protein EJ110_NYTH09812 [Nymphaea thermarum]
MLTRKLQLFRKQDKPVTEYVTGFKAICDELAAIGKPLTDDDKVFWLVNGLGPGYESFMTSILNPPVPPYLDVVSLLHLHETMRDLHAGETRLNSQMAFFTRQSNIQNDRRRYNNNWRNNNTNTRFNSKGRWASGQAGPALPDKKSLNLSPTTAIMIISHRLCWPSSSIEQIECQSSKLLHYCRSAGSRKPDFLVIWCSEWSVEEDIRRNAKFRRRFSTGYGDYSPNFLFGIGFNSCLDEAF